MKIKILGSAAGLPSKTRHTQSFAIDLIEEINEYFLVDAGEALQHRILDTNIKPSKVTNIFITHLHGDHIFGLPGFLSSRAHQGGEGLPLTIYGPEGLKEWLEATFSLTSSHLNYPIDYVEVKHGDHFSINDFDVDVFLLEHNIDSFLYTFKEPDKKGALNKEKLISIGIKPGPRFKEIKNSDEFEHDGVKYLTNEFLGAPVPGRKLAIHGDTRVVTSSNYYQMIQDSDLIIHEATYLKREHEKAHQYFHSEIHDVLQNFSHSNYQNLILSHISNRYDEDDLKSIDNQLPDHINLASDYLEITIQRASR